MRAPAPTITTILVACLAAFSLSACAPPAPEPSPTPTGFASEEEAFAAAEETYRAYVDALNDVDLADPETFEPVYALLSGDANDQERKTLSGYHAEGWQVEGSSRVVELARLSWDASTGIATLGSCVDVSAVEVLDESGDSVVDSERRDIQSVLITLEAPLDAEKFKISALTGRDGEPEC